MTGLTDYFAMFAEMRCYIFRMQTYTGVPNKSTIVLLITAVYCKLCALLFGRVATLLYGGDFAEANCIVLLRYSTCFVLKEAISNCPCVTRHV